MYEYGPQRNRKRNNTRKDEDKREKLNFISERSAVNWTSLFVSCLFHNYFFYEFSSY